MSRSLTIATAQFAVSGDVQRNLAHVQRQIREASTAGAHIVQFSESALSGYAGVDFSRHSKRRDAAIERGLDLIRECAADVGIWAIVGGHAPAPDASLPHNCLWVVDSRGELVCRYDKRFCTGDVGQLDHRHYTPGRGLVQFELHGVTCGLLICHEWRYPELYRQQMAAGTELLFQSWYDGNLSAAGYRQAGEDLGSLIVGTVRGNAANNHLWISASNTSGRESCFASFVVQPDGRVVKQLKRNVTGLLITKVDVDQAFSDPSGPWRRRAVQGDFRSG
jgi:predicted amidohydrolase